jgi:hypothetical protein
VKARCSTNLVTLYLPQDQGIHGRSMVLGLNVVGQSSSCLKNKDRDTIVIQMQNNESHGIMSPSQPILSGESFESCHIQKSPANACYSDICHLSRDLRFRECLTLDISNQDTAARSPTILHLRPNAIDTICKRPMLPQILHQVLHIIQMFTQQRLFLLRRLSLAITFRAS